jgi:pyruvate/2-oxoacid:ferredoxin oxidoreductase alpha subunit
MRDYIQNGKASKNITYGNKALAYGAIASELEYFSAYPMTPASTVSPSRR